MQVGVAIAAVSSVALAAAALISRSFNASLALLATLTALAGWIVAARSTTHSFEVSVASDGEVRIRDRGSPNADPLPVSVSFAAPWLISLRCGTMLIPIWPDSLPSSVFRQLWIHLRWGRAVPNGEKATINRDK
jgi:hypothetical protein